MDRSETLTFTIGQKGTVFCSCRVATAEYTANFNLQLVCIILTFNFITFLQWREFFALVDHLDVLLTVLHHNLLFYVP